ncbi:phage holin family protein [Lysinibacillus sp. FSL K6-0057]|uniref:phage holin family protein n=1 Tax=Lysinibacillus sp. FSL K6-0057 TaxID=2921411 RepID=UPI003159FA76
MEVLTSVWSKLISLLSNIFIWYYGLIVSLLGISFTSDTAEFYVVMGTTIFLAVLFDFTFAVTCAWLNKNAVIKSRRIRDTFDKLVAMIIPFAFLSLFSLTSKSFESLGLLHNILDGIIIFYIVVVVLCELISVLETSADMGFPHARVIKNKILRIYENYIEKEDEENEDK